MKTVPPRPEGLAFRRAAFFGFSTLGRGAGTDPDLVALGGATLGWADLAFLFLGASVAGASALTFPAGFRFATMRSPLSRTSTVGRVKGNSLSWRTARLYNWPGHSLARFGQEDDKQKNRAEPMSTLFVRPGSSLRLTSPSPRSSIRRRALALPSSRCVE